MACSGRLAIDSLQIGAAVVTGGLRMEDTAGGTGAITTTASLRLRLCVFLAGRRWPAGRTVSAEQMA